MRVIVADDQADVRSALRLMLEEKPGINVVGEASSSNELISQVKDNQIDLILLDWEIPEMKPEELMPLLRNFNPRVSIIALSSRPQMRKVALDFGAHYFICKSDPPERLLAILDSL
jgi:SARP family transcriptional regulator, regulator of embCAB operon